MDKQIMAYPYKETQLSNEDQLWVYTILKNLKIVLNERSQAKKREKEHSVWFHLYETLENAS